MNVTRLGLTMLVLALALAACGHPSPGYDAGAGGGGGAAGGGGATGGGAGGSGGGGVDAGAPDCTVPALLDWGTVTNNSSTSRTIVLNNPQSVAVTAVVGIVSSATGDNAAFPQSAQGMLPIGPQSTLTLTFRFEPHVSRSYAAQVLIQAAASCPTTTVQLRGTAGDPGLTWSPTAVDFGYVPIGASAPATLVFTNRGPAPAQVTNVTSTSASFTVDGGVTSFFVPGDGGTASLQLLYRPRLLGPSPEQLTFSTDVAGQPTGSVPLRGIGGGPTIDAPNLLAFGQVAYFATAVPPAFQTRTLVVRNVGTRPTAPDPVANLRLGLAGVQPYFSLRALNGTTSASEVTVTLNPSYPAATGLAAGEQTDLQVTLTPASVGPKAVELTIYSNDLLTPARQVTVTGDAVVLPACVFTVTPALSFGLIEPGTRRELAVEVTNTGTDACLLSNIELRVGTDAAFSLTGGPVSQVSLPAGQTTTLLVAAAPVGPPPASVMTLTGALQLGVSSPTRPMVTVPLDAQVGEPCLVITPSAFDFGTVQRDCSSATRSFTVYNLCATGVQLGSATMAQAAGEPAGGPNCPGTVACPEFLVESGIASNTTIAPRGSATFSLKYHPIDLGADHGVFRLDVVQPSGAVTHLLPLTGLGDPTGARVDTVPFPARPQADVLLVIDDGSTMGPAQQAFAADLAAFLQYATASQTDFHLGVTNLSGRILGAPDIFNPTTPNLAPALAARIYVGTAGTGPRATLASAVSALTSPLINSTNTGFLRASAPLGVVIVSNADDASPLAVAAYVDRLRDLKPAGGLTLSALAPLLASPPAGCSYNGAGGAPRLTSAVTGLGGVLADVCNATLSDVGKTAFGFRTSFPLSAVPDLTGGRTLEVRLDGTLMPNFDMRGGPIWSWDAASNSVVFVPLYVPPPGMTLTFTYFTACLP